MREYYTIGEYRLTTKKGSPNYYASWYDKREKKTKRTSLGTSDLEAAKVALARYVTLASEMSEERPEDALLSKVFARYYDGHAKKLASADTSLRALNYWLEFYGSGSIADLTVDRQEGFIAFMRSKNAVVNGKESSRKLNDGYIRRIISVGKAALNYSYKRQEIASVPHIWTVPDSEPAERIYTMMETAKLFNECEPGSSLFMFLMLAYNTLGRPRAILDLQSNQIDLKNNLISLLPVGERQTKKRRPTLPITKTLLPWVQTCTGDRYVNFHGKPIANNKTSFNSAIRRARIDPDGAGRNAIRHTMATELRRRGVSNWDVEGWLGHRLPSTSERYAKFSPDYFSDGVSAIDEYFDDLQKLVNYPLKMCNALVTCQNKRMKKA